MEIAEEIMCFQIDFLHSRTAGPFAPSCLVRPLRVADRVPDAGERNVREGRGGAAAVLEQVQIDEPEQRLLCGWLRCGCVWWVDDVTRGRGGGERSHRRKRKTSIDERKRPGPKLGLRVLVSQ